MYHPEFQIAIQAVATDKDVSYRVFRVTVFKDEIDPVIYETWEEYVQSPHYKFFR